jgi:hypothetical protein
MNYRTDTTTLLITSHTLSVTFTAIPRPAEGALQWSGGVPSAPSLTRRPRAPLQLDCVQLRPPCQANIHSASQKIPKISQYVKMRFRVHKSPPPARVLRHMDPLVPPLNNDYSVTEALPIKERATSSFSVPC